MDDIEGKRNVRPDQRVDQFMRLREVIEERASRKFFEEKAQADQPWCCEPTIFLNNSPSINTRANGVQRARCLNDRALPACARAAPILCLK